MVLHCRGFVFFAIAFPCAVSVGAPTRVASAVLGTPPAAVLRPVARIEQNMEKAMAKQSEEIRSLVQRGDSNLDSAMQQVFVFPER